MKRDGETEPKIYPWDQKPRNSEQRYTGSIEHCPPAVANLNSATASASRKANLIPCPKRPEPHARNTFHWINGGYRERIHPIEKIAWRLRLRLVENPGSCTSARAPRCTPMIHQAPDRQMHSPFQIGCCLAPWEPTIPRVLVFQNERIHTLAETRCSSLT